MLVGTYTFDICNKVINPTLRGVINICFSKCLITIKSSQTLVGIRYLGI